MIHKEKGILTQKRLKELLQYTPETGEFKWVEVSKYHNEKKNTTAGGIEYGWRDGRPYIRIGIDGKLYQAHRLAFLYMVGVVPKNIDHINGISIDNRFQNLKDASNSENCQNRIKRLKKSGLPMGVRKINGSSKYYARIFVKGKSINIGSFNSPEKAYSAYIKAKKRYHYCPVLSGGISE